MYKYLPLILLSGCQLYGGMAIHSTTQDSHFREERFIGNIGVSQEIHENIDLFAEHLSMPTVTENGLGINQVGVKIKVKLYL